MECRENPDRCFYVLGEINEDLVRKLTPEINRLRVEGNEPVTMYIDSPGGDTYWADRLVALAKAFDPDGNSRELVTVAIGECASAALDLLIHGDHAIAYPHALLTYHGVRTSRSGLTYEGASQLASTLQRTNERYALALARTTFPRMLFVLAQLPSFGAFKASEGYALDGIAGELSDKVGESAKDLIHRANAKCSAMLVLSHNVSAEVAKERENVMLLPYTYQKKVFDMIAEAKYLAHLNQNDWGFEDGDWDEIINEFRLFKDFHFGAHRKDHDPLAENYGKVLLSETELATLKFMENADPPTPPRGLARWLWDRSGRRLESLWYFVVSLARILQADDFDLAPEDAFWLGMVDEVPGSEVLSLRKVMELTNEAGKTSESNSRKNKGATGDSGASPSPPGKVAARKAPANKAPANKVPANKVPANKVPANKVPANKVPANKAPAVRKPRTGKHAR